MTGTTGPGAHDLIFMLHAALSGFNVARQRLDAAAAPGAPPERVFLPLTEALWWTVSVDDGFKELADTGGLNSWRSKHDYEAARNKDPSGRVLCGLRYARDRCGHQLALIALEDDLRLPFRLPNTFGEFFRWRPSDKLPQPRAANHHKQAEKKRPPYDLWLAGRPAQSTVETAANWFARAAAQAGL